MRPFETAPSSWPARPMRCRPRATDFGDSTWITRSTAPMSMPSSSYDVATRHGMRPAFRSSSTMSRCSRASEPWCARAISPGWSSLLARQLVQPQREPLGEAAVVDEDDRRAVLARRAAGSPGRSTARSTASRARCRRPSPGRRPARATRATRSSRARACPRPGRRPRGRAPCACRRRRASISRPPETKRPISSSGRCVADRPMRWNGLLGERVRAARPRAPGARRASCRRPRAPRRGSASRRRAAISRACEVSIR